MYNRWSAWRYGWDPSWFAAKAFDDTLANKILLFQMKYGLKISGKCEKNTYKRAKIEKWHFLRKLEARKANYIYEQSKHHERND